MPPSPDRKANFDSRTESVKTGDGRFVRVQELYKALATLNQVQLEQLIKKAGVRGAVADPFEERRNVVVEDLVDLCRTRPQYCLPLVETAQTLPTAGVRFKGLLRDRAFGTAAGKDEHAPAHSSDGIRFEPKVLRTLFETRTWPGEFQVFLTGDQRVLTLSHTERFDSHEPYEICFVVVRTADGRFWLRWPEQHRDVPAWYLDALGEAVWFFPHAVDGEDKDFEELFPGHTYEVFGVQFQVPDIGTDYSVYYDDDLDAWTEWDPSDAAARRREQADAQARGEAWRAGEAPPPPTTGGASELQTLLAALELKPGEITDRRGLSKHYRKLSVRYHPLKFLDAPEAQKDAINARYVEITTAYNALKAWFP